MAVSPDLKLIEAACQGDKEAIEQVLLQYHPTVTRFARKYCATAEDVEDAVQETLWIAAQKIGTLRVASAFVSWLFQVVRHECYRLLRIQQREYSVDDMLDQADENAELYLELQHDLIAAIAALPTQHRQVLILRDMEGMAAAEVAAMLGITLETVKSRLHRARVSLRQTLVHWRE